MSFFLACACVFGTCTLIIGIVPAAGTWFNAITCGTPPSSCGLSPRIVGDDELAISGMRAPLWVRICGDNVTGPVGRVAGI